jgi:GH25 family lysozyme M1 (1,4-beta-N-acetylmuramidase)
MLYSSAYYLTRLWGDNFKNQWLAYYTDKNDYTEKPFMLWQATSSGKVDGVPGFVDIDILYKNKIK